MNKLIGLYIILIILIALFALFNVNLYPAFLLQIPFTSFLHKLFEGVSIFIFILIFLRTNKLYSQTQDKRMAVIAGGFLAGICLNLYHLFSTFGVLYNFLNVQNIDVNPALIYLVAEKLIVPISIFIAVFYTQKSCENKSKNFRIITYFLYFFIFLLIIFLDQYIFPLLFKYIFHKVILFEQSFCVIDEALYFLMAFILADRKTNGNKNIFSKFILSLIILGVSELFCINPMYLGINEIIAHSLKLVGFFLIFLGIKDFQLLSEIKSVKQKLLVFLAWFLIISYLIFSLFHSMKIYLSSKFPYIFIEFLLFSAIIGYIITTKFTLPISNIIRVINKHNPKEKSEKIQIISNDEIGELSEKLNEIIDREWDYSQELLENQRKIQELLDKEQLLFKITTTIRSSLDINETLTIICDEVAGVFNVQRATIIEYPDKENYSEWIIKREFKINSDIKGVTDPGYDIRNIEYIGKTVLGQGKILVNDNISKADTPDYFRESYDRIGVKSNIGVPIKKGEDKWGILFISEYEYFRRWKEDDVILLQTIADQVYIAIKQAELFETVKQTAQRERLLRQIVETIRSTLDINEVKKSIVNEMGKVFNADRCYFRAFDKKSDKFLPPDVEYLASPDMKSLINVEPDQEGLIFFADILKQGKGSFPIVVDIDSIKDPLVERYMKNAGILVDYAIPIRDREDELAYLVLHYAKQKPDLGKEDLDLMETIAKQVTIAIDQAKLYETIKEQAENERILREIISEIKISQTLEEVYDYIVAKLADIFDTERAFFIEMPELENENPSIKHQYHKRADIPFIPDHMIREKCLMNLFEAANKKGIAIINNTAEHNKDDERLQNFFNDFNVKSILLVPLIRYNHDIKLLGAIVLCLGKVKNWSEDEINLIKSIAGSTATVMWEIKKRTELEELRNVFILTLTHDLQVPLVGEHKALEFITSRPDDQPIGKFKGLIADILKSNEGLTTLLKKLLNSYNFESGKQKLDLSLQHLSIPIIEVIDSLKNLADSKQISIETQIDENLPPIIMDSEQIKNVLHTLLENSITYIQQGGHIIIKSSIEKDKIITSVEDNGPGIPYKTSERIFERFAMAIAIERKIGAGLGLYLAKQIIEAHRGRIWFETEIGKGATFYFSLPLG